MAPQDPGLEALRGRGPGRPRSPPVGAAPMIWVEALCVETSIELVDVELEILLFEAETDEYPLSYDADLPALFPRTQTVTSLSCWSTMRYVCRVSMAV